ncbi:MAG: ABC transporter substrate-binding protein [Dongiaceae bacterium]
MLPIRTRGREIAGRRELGLAFGALLLAAGFAAGPQPARAADAKPLVIARDMDLNSLDPSRAFCDTCQIYLNAVYNTLLTIGPDNRTLKPVLAQSWEANADQTKFTFHLDPKATFADGSPVEAKDVKWTLERLQNLKGSASYMMDGVKSVEAPDAHTVVVTMAAPNSEFIGILAAPNTGIIDSDAAIAQGAQSSAEAAGKDSAEPWFLAHSAGSGPYVLESYKPNDELRLKANPAYWGARPAIDTIVLRQVKEAASQSQMLENGAADIAMQLDPDTAKAMTSPDVTYSLIPSYNFLYFALSPGAKGAPKLTPEIRQAMGYAVDYQGAIELTLAGNGKLQASAIPNGFPGGHDLPMPVHDVEKAKALLAQAGVADGFTIESKYPNMTIYGVDMSTLMQKIQQDLAKVKIKVELQPVTFTVWREQVRGEGIPLTAAFFAPDYFGSAQYVQYFGMIHGAPWAKRAGAEKMPELYNKAEEDAFNKALASGGEAMDQAYQEVGRQMIADRVIIPVVSPDLVLAYRKDVKGVRYSSCCNTPLAEISR